MDVRLKEKVLFNKSRFEKAEAKFNVEKERWVTTLLFAQDNEHTIDEDVIDSLELDDLIIWYKGYKNEQAAENVRREQLFADNEARR